MYAFRNWIANISRSTPYFHGKFRLGKAIGRLLSNYDRDGECINTIAMKDGYLMQLDIRSRTEAWSYWTGEYDNDIISKLSSCFKKDFVVFDVGANSSNNSQTGNAVMVMEEIPSNYFLPKFGHSFLDVVDIVMPWNYRFFKQTSQGDFIEVKKPDVGLEHVLLVPSETPDSTLIQMGVKFN